MLEVWIGTFIAEALLYTPLLWRFKRGLAVVTGVYVAITTVKLSLALGSIVGVPFELLAVFRLFNLSRIVKARMHEHYLRQVTARTSSRLFLLHLLLVWGLLIPLSFSHHQPLLILQAVQLLVAVTVLVVTTKNILKLRFKMPERYLVDHELPTVTVAIPARNETTDLEECLQSVLANHYPKLEIIVLDDCSQDRTAEIIRSFAHDGVRFVQGDDPQERWLSKNQAYQRLYEEASGDLILFCGVDVRFGPDAIRSMVNLLYARQKTMLSVLPVRGRSSLASAFIQPMRYWWELALPRRIFRKPPVLSTCWLIERKTLKKLGGFGAICHAIIPEAVLARELVKTDQYSFVRSSQQLDVRSVKTPAEQRETAIRTRYPQIRRRPEWLLLLSLLQIIFLLLPFILLVGSIWWPSVHVYLAAATCLVLVLSHLEIVYSTNPTNMLLACFNFPLVVVTEIILGYVSMIQYEFFTVEWKNRNICIPVMHVVPKLPQL